MDILAVVVRVLLAAGLVGFLVERPVRGWRRTRLTICFDLEVDGERHEGLHADVNHPSAPPSRTPLEVS